MSNTIKTVVNDNSVEEFINSIENATRREDGLTLLSLYSEITGEPAKMWGTSIVGFGQYHYKSERSKQEGDWPLAGFSPRKQNLSLYVMTGFTDFSELLSRLGKYKTSVSCLYINKLSDVDTDVLKQIIAKSYQDSKKQFLG